MPWRQKHRFPSHSLLPQTKANSGKRQTRWILNVFVDLKGAWTYSVCAPEPIVKHCLSLYSTCSSNSTLNPSTRTVDPTVVLPQTKSDMGPCRLLRSPNKFMAGRPKSAHLLGACRCVISTARRLCVILTSIPLE